MILNFQFPLHTIMVATYTIATDFPHYTVDITDEIFRKIGNYIFLPNENILIVVLLLFKFKLKLGFHDGILWYNVF